MYSQITYKLTKIKVKVSNDMPYRDDKEHLKMQLSLNYF
jgi:hypothetical protein